MELTQDRLKELLHYDSETGVFTWRVSRCSVKAGDTAGNVNVKTGHRQIWIDRVRYYAHRLAWLYVCGCWPCDKIDHINGDTDDNRIANLREATQQQNSRNRKLSCNNTSGYSGVRWHSLTGKWLVQIAVPGKGQTHVGLFSDKDEAICARKTAERKYYGEFVRNAA